MRTLLAVAFTLAAGALALALRLPVRGTETARGEAGSQGAPTGIAPVELLVPPAGEAPREVAPDSAVAELGGEPGTERAADDAREPDDGVARATAIVMRLLGPDGALEERACQARYRLGAVRTLISAASDSDAQIRIPLASARPDGVPPPTSVEVRAGVQLGARIPVPPELAPRDGVVDLGDVLLLPLPLLVRGTVSNPDGLTVGGASVTTFSFLPADGSAPAPRGDSTAMMTTSADGEFAFFGWADADTHVHVQASHRAAPAGASACVPIGSIGVELVLRGGGAITGRVLLDDGVPPAGLLFAARRENDGHTARKTRPTGDGRLVLPNLAPGVYTVTARVDGSDELLAELSGVEVLVGERARPAGLEPLDLRGRMIRHVITVVNENGLPIDATVFHRASFDEGARWAELAHTPDAPAIVYTPSGSIDVTAAAKDRAWADLLGVGGAITLVCGEPYTVRLRLKQMLDEPNLSRLTARLEPERGEGRAGLASESATFGADGTCVLRAKGVGEHVLHLSVRGLAELRFPIGEDGRHRVDVAGSGAPHEILVDVSAAQMEAAWKGIEGLIDVW